jgi:hypothetical protein
MRLLAHESSRRGLLAATQERLRGSQTLMFAARGPWAGARRAGTLSTHGGKGQHRRTTSALNAMLGATGVPARYASCRDEAGHQLLSTGALMNDLGGAHSVPSPAHPPGGKKSRRALEQPVHGALEVHRLAEVGRRDQGKRRAVWGGPDPGSRYRSRSLRSPLANARATSFRRFSCCGSSSIPNARNSACRWVFTAATVRCSSAAI